LRGHVHDGIGVYQLVPDSDLGKHLVLRVGVLLERDRDELWVRYDAGFGEQYRAAERSQLHGRRSVRIGVLSELFSAFGFGNVC